MRAAGILLGCCLPLCLVANVARAADDQRVQVPDTNVSFVPPPGATLSYGESSGRDDKTYRTVQVQLILTAGSTIQIGHFSIEQLHADRARFAPASLDALMTASAAPAKDALQPPRRRKVAGFDAVESVKKGEVDVDTIAPSGGLAGSKMAEVYDRIVLQIADSFYECSMTSAPSDFSALQPAFTQFCASIKTSTPAQADHHG